MDYQTTAGIEIHCELKTNSKMFSPAPNNYSNNANTNIHEIDFAYPGVLPTINQKGVELALRAALLLHCDIHKTMYFDRKNYFYPDLPKGYQITQNRTPIGTDGYVEIMCNGSLKKIRIHDIHIEEDTAKSIHHHGKTLLDFNRCGVPLIEIVSEADIHTKEEAVAYVQKLRELFFYADISDCKIEEGSMRCDVNVSVSKTASLGVRTETKNVGSISMVGEVIEVEAKRQIDVLEAGGQIFEETRRVDEKKMETVLMRRKETGNDYRYFPDGDIPPLVLTDEFIKKVQSSLPVLPDERRQIYLNAGISTVNVEKIIANKKISDYLLDFEDVDLKLLSNLLLGDIAAYLNKENKTLEETQFTPNKMRIIVQKLQSNEITHKQFKDILPSLFEMDIPVEKLIEEIKTSSISEEDLLVICEKIVSQNPASLEDYLNGRDRAIKFFMGQIMKETKGKADPSLANELLMKVLKSRS